MRDFGETYRKSRWTVFGGITVLTGLASGISGMLLGLLLRLIQHSAYGYSLQAIVSSESFLEGVSSASPSRRLVALTLCGVVAGAGWWALYRLGKPLVSIAKAVKQDGPAMPFVSTLVHASLQIVTVALGSPLGREVAPRELGALLADRLSVWANLSPENRRIMIACGAGAGLAAVYNVPLGGTLFVLEVLVGSLSLSAVIPALTTCVIAALVARIGLGNITQYALSPPPSVSSSLIAWSILTGPIFGACAFWFVRAAGAARSHAARKWRLLLWCLTVFPAIGLLAIPFPQLLGNGKGIVQIGFDGRFGLGLAAALLVLRLVVTLGALRAGAEGGLLTPGLALGVILGSILGGLWNFVAPFATLSTFAIVGGAAFLASSMKMPVTAIILIMEFTRISGDFLVPISLAVAGSMAMFQFLAQRHANQQWKPQHCDIPSYAGEAGNVKVLTPQQI